MKRSGQHFLVNTIPPKPWQAGFWRGHAAKIVIALILTFASGLVDILGYTGIYHLFAAHLTGTTVQLGKSIVEGNGIEALAALSALASFFAGSVIGRTIIEIGSRNGLRRIASITLAFEAAMIASVPLIEGVISKNNSGMARYWPLTLLAAAMGLQTATLTRVGPLTVHTTFVTGMVNKLAQLLSHMMFRSFDLLGFSSGRLSSSPAANDDAQQAAFLFSIWTLYVSGAVCGTWLYKLWGMRALFLATGLILFGIAMDQFCALSIQEEKEQLEG